MGNTCCATPRDRELEEAKLETIKYEDFTCDAKVVKVYDGDTVTLAYRMQGDPNMPIIQENCRIMGIDAPEIKPPLADPNRDEIKRMAVEARDALRDMIFERVCEVHFIKRGKFGRWLVNIDFDGQDVAEWLVGHGYAKVYDGKGARPTHIAQI